MKSLEEWVAGINLDNLPVLRRTVLAFSYSARNIDGLSAADISEVVLHDPLMTLKVVGLANSRSRGRFNAEIASVHNAVIMLGIPPFFQHFATLSAVEEVMSERTKELTGLLNTLSRAHHAAWQARDLAVLRADVKAEEVYVGALLHDMGEIVMWCCASGQMRNVLKTARRSGISREEAEKEILGFTLWDFQQALSVKWKLPDLLTGFMDNKNAGNPRALMAIIGAALARHAATGWYSPKLSADYEVIAGQFNFPVDDVIAIIHHNAVVEGRYWDAYHVPPAAAWLPMLPGEWPEEPDDEEKEQQQAASAACLMPNAQELQRVMNEISAHLNGTLDLHDMMSLALQGMHEGIGLNRVVFALLTADRNLVKAKYVLGAEEGSPLRNFQLETKTPHLFTRLLSKMQSVWVNDANKDTFAPLLPPDICRMIGDCSDFFAMSVFILDKPVGLVYADRRHGNCQLDEHSYQEFKRLTLRATQGLAHLARK